MAKYIYQALGKDGQLTTGEVEAVDLKLAIETLGSRGLRVQAIRPIGGSETIPSGALELRTMAHPEVLPTPIDAATRARMERVLAEKARMVPLLEAYAAELPVGDPQRRLRELSDLLQQSQSVDPLAKHPEWLPFLFQLDATDSPDQLIQAFSGFQDAEQRQKFARMRLLYPIVLLAISLAIMVVVAWFIAPGFKSIFDDFMLELPSITKAFIWIANQLTQHATRSLLILATTFAIFVVVRHWWVKQAIGHRWCGNFFAGDRLSVNAMGRFVSQLHELLRQDVPLQDALRISGRACQFLPLERAASELAWGVQQGSFQITSYVERVVPANVLHALRPAPDAPVNLPLLEQLARLYTERVLNSHVHEGVWRSRLAVVMIGGLVLLIVLAVVAPLFKLLSAFTGSLW